MSEANASVYVQIQKWRHMWGQYTPKRHKARVSEKSSYKVLRGHFKLAGLRTMYIWLGPWPNAAH